LAVALSLGAGRKAPPYQVNPLTGQPYKIFRPEGRIELVTGDPARPQDELRILVPDLAPKQPPKAP
jgi:hypothetical protein